MIDDRFHLQLLIAAAILLMAGIYFGKEIPGDISAVRSRPLRAEDSAATMRLSLINSAVKDVPANSYFEYTGDFQNPFRVWNASRIQDQHRGPRTASKKTVRIKFILKGILTKHKPLAILEDGMGETYIRGIGDEVLDQTVVAIAKNRVTMRDRLGTYELVVEEN